MSPTAKNPTAKMADMRQYVTLATEVGVECKISKAANMPVIVREKILKSTPNLLGTTDPESLLIPVQPDKTNHLRDVHPRYSIFTYGCSPKVYGVISKSDRFDYKPLLGNRNMLDEHPWMDDASFLAV